MTCREGHAPRHPDFESGNTVAMKAGHYSPRVIDPIAAEIVAEVVEAEPYLAEVRYRATLHAWAREEARCRVLADYLDREGLHDQEGRLRPAEQAMHRAEVRASNLRKELGLTPLSRARLGRLAQEPGPTIFDLLDAALDAQANADTDDGGTA